jgi:hypothetical protein
MRTASAQIARWVMWVRKKCLHNKCANSPKLFWLGSIWKPLMCNPNCSDATDRNGQICSTDFRQVLWHLLGVVAQNGEHHRVRESLIFLSSHLSDIIFYRPNRSGATDDFVRRHIFGISHGLTKTAVALPLQMRKGDIGGCGGLRRIQ